MSDRVRRDDDAKRLAVGVVRRVVAVCQGQAERSGSQPIRAVVVPCVFRRTSQAEGVSRFRNFIAAVNDELFAALTSSPLGDAHSVHMTAKCQPVDASTPVHLSSADNPFVTGGRNSAFASTSQGAASGVAMLLPRPSVGTQRDGTKVNDAFAASELLISALSDFADSDDGYVGVQYDVLYARRARDGTHALTSVYLYALLVDTESTCVHLLQSIAGAPSAMPAKRWDASDAFFVHLSREALLHRSALMTVVALTDAAEMQHWIADLCSALHGARPPSTTAEAAAVRAVGGAVLPAPLLRPPPLVVFASQVVQRSLATHSPTHILTASETMVLRNALPVVERCMWLRDWLQRSGMSANDVVGAGRVSRVDVDLIGAWIDALRGTDGERGAADDRRTTPPAAVSESPTPRFAIPRLSYLRYSSARRDDGEEDESEPRPADMTPRPTRGASEELPTESRFVAVHGTTPTAELRARDGSVPVFSTFDNPEQTPPPAPLPTAAASADAATSPCAPAISDDMATAAVQTVLQLVAEREVQTPEWVPAPESTAAVQYSDNGHTRSDLRAQPTAAVPSTAPGVHVAVQAVDPECGAPPQCDPVLQIDGFGAQRIPAACSAAAQTDISAEPDYDIVGLAIVVNGAVEVLLTDEAERDFAAPEPHDCSADEAPALSNEGDQSQRTSAAETSDAPEEAQDARASELADGGDAAELSAGNGLRSASEAIRTASVSTSSALDSNDGASARNGTDGTDGEQPDLHARLLELEQENANLRAQSRNASLLVSLLRRQLVARQEDADADSTDDAASSVANEDAPLDEASPLTTPTLEAMDGDITKHAAKPPGPEAPLGSIVAGIVADCERRLEEAESRHCEEAAAADAALQRAQDERDRAVVTADYLRDSLETLKSLVAQLQEENRDMHEASMKFDDERESDTAVVQKDSAHKCTLTDAVALSDAALQCCVDDVADRSSTPAVECASTSVQTSAIQVVSRATAAQPRPVLVDEAAETDPPDPLNSPEAKLERSAAEKAALSAELRVAERQMESMRKDKIGLIQSLRGVEATRQEVQDSLSALEEEYTTQKNVTKEILRENDELRAWVEQLRSESEKLVVCAQASERERAQLLSLNETMRAVATMDRCTTSAGTSRSASYTTQPRVASRSPAPANVNVAPQGLLLPSTNPTMTGQLSHVSAAEAAGFHGYFKDPVRSGSRTPPATAPSPRQPARTSHQGASPPSASRSRATVSESPIPTSPPPQTMSRSLAIALAATEAAARERNDQQQRNGSMPQSTAHARYAKIPEASAVHKPRFAAPK